MTKKQFPHYWICAACAKAKGGVWPKDHCATMTATDCKYCDGKKQMEQFIAPWVDYDWPKDKAKTRQARATRD